MSNSKPDQPIALEPPAMKNASIRLFLQGHMPGMNPRLPFIRELDMLHCRRQSPSSIYAAIASRLKEVRMILPWLIGWQWPAKCKTKQKAVSYRLLLKRAGLSPDGLLYRQPENKELCKIDRTFVATEKHARLPALCK